MNLVDPLFFLTARLICIARYMPAVCVCPSQNGTVSERQNGSSWFSANRLHSSLCHNSIRVYPNVKTIPLHPRSRDPNSVFCRFFLFFFRYGTSRPRQSTFNTDHFHAFRQTPQSITSATPLPTASLDSRLRAHLYAAIDVSYTILIHSSHSSNSPGYVEGSRATANDSK